MMGMILNIARITRIGNLVVNLEAATQEWVDASSNDPFFYFVAYGDNLKDDQPTGIPFIGLTYDPVKKQFQDPASPPPYPEMTPELHAQALKIAEEQQAEIEQAERIVKGTKRASTKRSS